jgi:hypothetical protein
MGDESKKTKVGISIIDKVIKYKDKLIEKEFSRKHQLESDLNIVANIAAMSIIRFSENYGDRTENILQTFCYQVGSIITGNKCTIIEGKKN